MKIINLYGGPGSGKSTLAAYLFAVLKAANQRVELVGEEAKDLIYFGAKEQLSNQLYMFASQYSRLVNLERSGCRIAISDSPIRYNLLYCPKNYRYEPEMISICDKIETSHEFRDYKDIFVLRPDTYDCFGRVEKDVAEASLIDNKIRNQFANLNRKFDLEVQASRKGQKEAEEFILRWILDL